MRSGAVTATASTPPAVNGNNSSNNGLTRQPFQASDLNLNDVIEVIRHTDPATFQEFQQHLSAMSSSAVGTVGRPSPAELAKQKKKAFVRIVEQPASKGLRFRYECEGRSAGSIPGASSTNERKTFPTIEVVGYKGRAVVVVSCVTPDAPYRPHPHNLVGKEGCKKGVCTLEIPPDTMAMAFQSLGVQCVKKKEIEEAITLRQQIRVDPFQTGFSHRENPQSLDLNCVRLCFQVFLEGNEKGAFTFALKPVVSEPIFDKKAKTDLIICRITDCSASVAGGKEMLLFCDKVLKDDVQIRFFEEGDEGKVTWEGFGDFQPSDVHKQYGIAFRTPRYHNLELEEPHKVQLQLRRPSDGAVSDPRTFEFLPLDSGRGFWTSKRLKTNYNIFNSILSVDQNGGIRMANNNNNNGAMAMSVGEDDDLRRKIRLPATATLPSVTTSVPSSQAHQLSYMGQMQQQQQAVVQQPAAAFTMTSSFPPPPPPARNFHTLSMMPHEYNANMQNLLTPPTPDSLPPGKTRPLSGTSSIGSEVSNATDMTSKQSVNDILSMAADTEDMSVYSMDLNAALDGGDGGAMSFQALMKLEPASTVAAATNSNPHQSLDEAQMALSMKNPVVEIMGSMTSVATVQERKPSVTAETSPVKTEPTPAAMDTEMGALYDDVMQVVYDDVDVKYDGIDFPPQPPVRRSVRQPSVDLQETPLPPVTVDKPLPGTPSKLPTILNKFTGGGRSKEEEERKKREKEEKKTREREEKARKKEEDDKRKVEKKRLDEEKKAVADKTSLFQRLFTRSKSQVEDLESNGNAVASSSSPTDPNAPPVPAHGSNDADAANGNEPTEADLKDLQHFIDSGNLDHLDNMVSEFAKQYMTSDSEGNSPMTMSGNANLAATNGNEEAAPAVPAHAQESK